MPANTTFNAGASMPGWVCVPGSSAGSACTRAIGAVSGGGGGSQVYFAVEVDDPFPVGVTQVENTIEIGDDGANGSDPNPGDNIASDTTPVNTPPSNLQLSLNLMVIDENEAVDLSASFYCPDTQDTHSVMIDRGDESSTTVDATGDKCAFSASHQYLDDSTYTVSVTGTDSANQSACASTTVAVSNVAPQVGAISEPLAPVNINDPIIDFTVVFTDPGVLDTQAAFWDWGDESITPGTVIGSDGSGIVSDSHVYGEAGVYAVTLTVEDDDFGLGQSEPQFIVIYDPNGGFVTGGCWIDSPRGAYFPDPLLAGKATFGFVSKYKKGAGTPDGATEFHFKVANLNIHSNSYGWLVIADHKAMYKGLGMINGSGNFGFLLSATDADLTSSTEVDLFRIKIWDIDEGDKIVYDNQVACPDTADNAEPCAQISGGSIVIHKRDKK